MPSTGTRRRLCDATILSLENVLKLNVFRDVVIRHICSCAASRYCHHVHCRPQFIVHSTARGACTEAQIQQSTKAMLLTSQE